MTKETNTVGSRIRECRKALGLSQEALAELLYVKKATISKYENGYNDIPATMIVALADALGTTPNYLLLGQPEGAATHAWIEDMLLIMNKISEPVYRDLALKQLKCIAETVSRSDENSCKLLN